MKKRILIFGGAGFVGTQLVKRLANSPHEICVVCTNVTKARKNIGDFKNVRFLVMDIFSQEKIAENIKQHDTVINLIGKLYEEKQGDFAKYHTEFVEKLISSLTAEQHFIHISSLGVEKSQSSSIYAKTKYEAEVKIKNSLQNYSIIKPSVIFGPRDNFFNMFHNMAKISPFLPIIGSGSTLFSPVYVEDVVSAIYSIIETGHKNKVFAACGPDTASFRELLEFMLKTANKTRALLPIPFKIAKLQAKIMNSVKIYILTPDQVELLKYDNINKDHLTNIDTIIEKLHSYREIVPTYLKK